MKKILCIILVFFSFNCFSQKNIIKGRVFGINKPKIFTLGLGFERMINDIFSAQILFNRMGYDVRDTDGSAEFYNFLVPEVRYYFGKKESKKMFAGIFTELSRSQGEGSGEFADAISSGIPEKKYKGSETERITPGVLIGINNGTKKRWLIEFYLGGKYRFATETKEYKLDQETIFEKEKKQKLGLRIGMNFGFRF